MFRNFLKIIDEMKETYNLKGESKMMVKIIRSMDFDGLVDLFERSGLEIHKGDPVPAGLITCFELIDTKTGARLGASGICFEDGEYVLRCVAVEEGVRGGGYGRMLVEAVLEEARNHKAVRIWLTAKVPDFYKKFGFQIVPREEAPIQTSCTSCSQYHNGCESEVMVHYFLK